MLESSQSKVLQFLMLHIISLSYMKSYTFFTQTSIFLENVNAPTCHIILQILSSHGYFTWITNVLYYLYQQNQKLTWTWLSSPLAFSRKPPLHWIRSSFHSARYSVFLILYCSPELMCTCLWEWTCDEFYLGLELVICVKLHNRISRGKHCALCLFRHTVSHLHLHITAYYTPVMDLGIIYEKLHIWALSWYLQTDNKWVNEGTMIMLITNPVHQMDSKSLKVFF